MSTIRVRCIVPVKNSSLHGKYLRMMMAMMATSVSET